MKKVITFILAILTILLIFYLIYIRIDLVGKEDMPDIVFMYSYEYNHEYFESYVFDKNGNIYYSSKEEVCSHSYKEKLDLYATGELKNKMELIGTIDTSELEKFFQSFLEIMHDGGVNLTSDDCIPDVIAPWERWYGLYYDKNGDVELTLLYQEDAGTHYTNDTRADEIVEWMKQIVDKYKPSS